MILSLNKTKIYLAIFSISMLAGCFDKPDDFVAPTWNAEINFPITQKSFSLLELIEKDSSFLKSSNDPSNLGLIYFGDTQAVSSIRIEDELKIDAFETSFSHSIGPIQNIVIPVTETTDIRVEDWTTDVTSGSNQVFPEQEGNVVLSIEGIKSVESIFAEEGNLRIIVRNKLPVPIELRGITIRNTVDQSIVAQSSDSDPNQWITVPPNLASYVVFPIENKEITNNLEYVGTIYSVGSFGEFVQVPEEAGTEILAIFSDLTIASATAALPVQSFDFEKSIIIDDSTKILEALIGSGRAALTASNNMDVDLTVSVLLENLFDSNGDNYKFNFPLLRNQKNYITDIQLKTAKLVTLIPGVPTNEIQYSVSVVTDSTGVISTIGKSDSISFDLSFDGLVFDSFTGLLKPTMLKLKNTGLRIDYGDLNNKFGFDVVNFNTNRTDAYADFRMEFFKSSDVEIDISGKIRASNNIQSEYQNVSFQIPSNESIEISGLINKFSSQLPDSFAIKGSAILNPLYKVATVSRGDSIYGALIYDIPLNVGIGGGTYIDTLDINLGDVDEDDIERLNYGMAKIIIENTVPVDLWFKAAILDSSYTKVLDLPTPSNNLDSVSIPKPILDDNGEILSSGKSEIELALYGEEVQKLLNNPYLLIEVSFSTAGNNNEPIKFKTSQGISFEVKAHAEYKVEL